MTMMHIMDYGNDGEAIRDNGMKEVLCIRTRNGSEGKLENFTIDLYERREGIWCAW